MADANSAIVLACCAAALIALAASSVAIVGQRIATPLVYGVTALVSAVGGAVALLALLGGHEAMLRLPLGLPWIGANFRVDPLSSFFLVVVNLGGLGSSIYGLGYGRHEEEPARVLPFFPAFLAAMNLVVLSDDAFSFLVSWEFMSLMSWALVMARHRDKANAHAGYVYILMAAFSGFALLLCFGLLAGSGGHYAFSAMRAAGAGAPYAAVLILALLGAGSKAGLAPLHAWLPLAHPAAPSHVSALMSGVMTKVAVYAFIRIVFDLAGSPQWWWAIVVLALAGATAVMGVLYALMQHDLKRLLAYHTVENIGIVFIGLGLALAFRSNGLAGAAALALTAALFHVLNHSIFKSLLFFGSGAVQSATGERDLERLGGLIRPMPLTALAFLVGCAAISALPPLNGFVSEWLTFQAILLSPQLAEWGLKLIVPAIGVMLALSAALAAACFVKAFGIAFLGRPRSPAAGAARETDRFSLATLLVYAALCLIAGILPGYVIDALGPASQSLLGAHMPQQSSVAWLSIVPIAQSRSSYNGLLVFAFIAASAAIAAYAIHTLASRAIRRAPAWDCGFPNADPATQYTASGFAQPIRRVFGSLVFAAEDRVAMPPPGDAQPARLTVRVKDLIWDYGYAPVAYAVDVAATRLNILQTLTIRGYLSLVFGVLVFLLLALTIWR
ncbi:MAG TPA: hydrogenase 4 subunit B [Rhizomicrobium sp.]|nr:hydrogenase 4 subunit B [Rhizomicrobium sp.]